MISETGTTKITRLHDGSSRVRDLARGRRTASPIGLRLSPDPNREPANMRPAGKRRAEYTAPASRTPGAGLRHGHRRRPGSTVLTFLLQDQRPDGSWGSPERTKDLNIIAGIGSHHAFRVATTCALRLGPDRAGPRRAGVGDAHGKAVHRAIERGEEFLFRELPAGPPR